MGAARVPFGGAISRSRDGPGWACPVGGQAVAGGVELAWRSPTAMLGWVEPLRRHGGASPVLFRPLMGELACIVFLDWVTYHMW